jgi:acetyl-CoA/propionyl-CoA carboxylase, biotin carboxylase, biotin carboxyl carrier protein
MFEAVLVANRGEIAVRVIRTLQALDIKAIAVYSDEDRSAKHVAMADEAWRIGPSPPRASYLSIDQILEATIRSGATALHPGYGFLAENAELAQACLDHGVVFIGPPAEAIWTMGDKNRAKATVAENGVRVVPGVDGTGLDTETLANRAGLLQFPVLIKPAGGGGGKGMRRVDDPAHLEGQIEAARREALSSFGNDELLIEQLIERPRHVEVQIVADSHGSFIHLGERECSLQRRHQKVIEEAPSPLLNEHQRNGIAEQAVAAARACRYVNVGTVEFILATSNPDTPYFLEMNTRLQVEHPVTELVWGVDLVELQLQIAAGHPLAFGQADLGPAGHAIEARVYAEDPDQGFIPTGGQILQLHEPGNLVGVRVDSCLKVGLAVGSTYDPMLSKVIAWGDTRNIAIRRLDGALADSSILGVTTNVSYLRHLLSNDQVARGELDTGLIDRIPPPSTESHHEVAIVAAILTTGSSTPRVGKDLWAQRTNWRIGAPAWSTWHSIDSQSRNWEVRTQPHDEDWTATVAGTRYDVSDYRVDDDRVCAHINGQPWCCTFAPTVEGIWLGHEGSTWHFRTVPLRGVSDSHTLGEGSIKSPMPGIVTAVHATVGDVVKSGQTLVTVEAMKMEHNVLAPFDGSVATIEIDVGSSVDLAQTLVRLERAELRTDPVPV